MKTFGTYKEALAYRDKVGDVNSHIITRPSLESGFSVMTREFFDKNTSFDKSGKLKIKKKRGGMIKKFSSGGAAKRGFGKVIK
jgi:hypothetical protein